MQRHSLKTRLAIISAFLCLQVSVLAGLWAGPTLAAGNFFPRLTAAQSATDATDQTTLPAVNVTDLFNRVLNTNGLTLVDWQGYLANPVVEFCVAAPATAAYPATATLTANGGRLYFDLPSTIGANGPRKQLTFAANSPCQPVLLAIFPDRNRTAESYTLTIQLRDAQNRQSTTTLPIRVIDQDDTADGPFPVTVNFAQDTTGFYTDPAKQAIVVQAAKDWFYFFDNMQLAPVAANAEQTWIWNADGFYNGRYIRNQGAYTGFLLYSYGIHDPTALRSGGEGSYAGGFQVSNGAPTQLRRSGGYQAETAGNYNTLGWFLTTDDNDWWHGTNYSGEAADLYSIAHHEIGHAIIFNGAYPRTVAAKQAGVVNDPTVIAYLGRAPAIDNLDHFHGEIDPASRRGAFGYEYDYDGDGNMPLFRWTVTKLDLLNAQALGYRLRQTSAFLPLRIVTSSAPAATQNAAYQLTLTGQGGTPFYHWRITAGALPTGLTLNAFTGVIRGIPTQTGTFPFTVTLADYQRNGATVSRAFTLVVNSSTPGTINGTVRNQTTNAPLPQVTVRVYRKQGNLWLSEVAVRTNANGQYSFPNRPPGTLRLRFTATGYQTEYFDNAAAIGAGTDIVLTAGATVNNINAALTPLITALTTITDTTQLYGQVVDATTGQPVSGATVALYTAADWGAEDGAIVDCPQWDGPLPTGIAPTATAKDAPPTIDPSAEPLPLFIPQSDPQLTAADGSFVWPTTGGCLYVTATAPGYITATGARSGDDETPAPLPIALTPAIRYYLPLLQQ